MRVPPLGIAADRPAQLPHSRNVAVVQHLPLQVPEERLHSVQPGSLHRQPYQVQLPRPPLLQVHFSSKKITSAPSGGLSVSSSTRFF